jgi:hypothetical protein
MLADCSERCARKIGGGLEAQGVDELLVVWRWPAIAQVVGSMGVYLAHQCLEVGVACRGYSDKYNSRLDSGIISHQLYHRYSRSRGARSCRIRKSPRLDPPSVEIASGTDHIRVRRNPVA